MRVRRRSVALLLALPLLSWFGSGTAEEPAVPAYPPSGRPAEIVLYESDAQLLALAGKAPTVLFFFAAWCPNCQAAVREFQTRWDDARPGFVLVIADYDKETALKARYGIAFQDTYVQIAPDGGRLRAWNGGGLDALNANILGLAEAGASG